jgi:hypothetical protein
MLGARPQFSLWQERHARATARSRFLAPQGLIAIIYVFTTS